MRILLCWDSRVCSSGVCFFVGVVQVSAHVCLVCVWFFVFFLRYSGGVFLNVVDLLHHVCLLLCCVCFTSVRITCVGVYVCVCVCVVMWLGNN